VNGRCLRPPLSHFLVNTGDLYGRINKQNKVGFAEDQILDW
jgi:hypothetical protein